MTKHLITLGVNGERCEIAVEAHWTLLEAVREQLRFTGSKEGCGTGDCGACSMILRGPFDPAQDRPQDEQGRLITSCLMLGVQANGCEVLTIEGLAQNGTLHPIQQAFIDTGG